MSRSHGPASPAPSLQQLRAAGGKPPSAARRLRRWLIAAGAAAVIVLFGFFGLPPIVKAQATKQLSARLGREVTIEKIRINPLVLSTSIEGFAIAEADPQAGEFTGWRRLFVNFDSWSLLRGEPRFQEIDLDGFRARVAKRPDGSFNFDDIVALLTGSAPDAPASATPSRPPAIAIDKLVVRDAQADFADSSRLRPFATTLGPVSFSLEKFRTVGDPNSPYQFEAVTGSGERLAWKGTVSADPVRSQGELVLANIDLARLSPYYHELVRGELRSAFMDVSGRYTLELKDGQPVLTLADGAFALRELRFGESGVEADAFALGRVAVTGISADSSTLRAHVAKVAVEGVRVKATRLADGEIDLLRLLQPASRPIAAAPVAPAGPSAMPVVTLDEFSLSDVRAELVDLTTPRRAEHRVEDVTLTLRDLDSSALGKAIPLSLVVKLPQDGRIAVTGSASPQPLAGEWEIELDRVPFANASPYVEPLLNIRLAGGTVRAKGRATLRDGAAAYAGDFGIGGFATVDGKLAQDFVKWTDLAVSGIRLSTEPLAFHADLIRFVEPSALLRVDADGSLNIAQAAPSAPAPAPASAPATDPSRAAPAAAVSVDRFELAGAAFRYEDRSSKPAARGALTGFSGRVSGLSSEALGRADVDLRGVVDGVAPVLITGKLNPLGAPAFVDLKLDFRGIDLQPGAGPYIARFVGRDLSRGSFTLAVTAKLNERQVNMDNVVTLDQFYLGQKNNSPDGTSLPVNLALALLRDAQGKIVLDVPVKGSLDDPEFKIGRVVARVLMNILSKAATSPFSLLGAAFGGGGDELGWQDFAPGAAAPDATGIQKLATVARALTARPSLSLDIVGAHDPVADLASLRRARLDAEVRAAAWEARREVDPNTPPPEELVITPELRAGMLARLHALAFPDEIATPGSASMPSAPAAPAVSPFAPAPTTKVGPQVGRLPKFSRPNVFSSRTARPEPKDNPAPAPSASPFVATPSTGGEPAEASGAGVPLWSPEQMEERLAARIVIPEAELQALAVARATAIRDWLVETGKVPAERIFLGASTAGGTRVNLNLK